MEYNSFPLVLRKPLACVSAREYKYELLPVHARVEQRFQRQKQMSNPHHHQIIPISSLNDVRFL